jgi:hypothetical protein
MKTLDETFVNLVWWWQRPKPKRRIGAALGAGIGQQGYYSTEDGENEPHRKRNDDKQ